MATNEEFLNYPQKKANKQLYKLGLVALLMIALSILTIDDNGRQDLLLELGKSGISFICVVFLGSAATTAFKLLDDHRAEQQKLAEYKKQLVGSIRSAYLGIKKTRRELRAHGLSRKHRVMKQESFSIEGGERYFEAMRRLCEDELVIENTKLEILSYEGVFPNAARLVQELVTIENYLMHVVTEWEKLGVRTLGSAELEAKEIPCLLHFTDDHRKGGFRREVSTPIMSIVSLLQAEILGGPTPRPIEPDRGGPTAPQHSEERDSATKCDS